MNHDETAPLGYEVAQSITVTVEAIEAAIDALRARTVELHARAVRLDSNEARHMARLLADKASGFAEEFRKEARRVDKFIRKSEKP